MRAKQPAMDELVYYPESDGKPMGETEIHIDLMMDLIHALKTFFSDDPLVHVGGNLLLYYVEGNPKKSVAPDVFVVRGMDKKRRRTYRVWKEGRAPDVVIELTSKKTRREDQHKKRKLYEQLGVKEYYLYDPEREYLPEPLTAWRRSEDGTYQPASVIDGRVRSEALGLALVDTGETLRLYDPTAQRFLPTPQEESEMRRQAEAEIQRLREELKRQRRGRG